MCAPLSHHRSPSLSIPELISEISGTNLRVPKSPPPAILSSLLGQTLWEERMELDEGRARGLWAEMGAHRAERKERSSRENMGGVRASTSLRCNSPCPGQSWPPPALLGPLSPLNSSLQEV